MTLADLTPLIGLYMGAFAGGWAGGYLYLVFRKIAETTT